MPRTGKRNSREDEKMTMKTLMTAALAVTTFGVSAETTIDLDLKAKPIKDMKTTANGVAMGVNGAMEAWLCGVEGNDDILYVSNRFETARAYRQAGLRLMRLQGMNSWFNCRKPNPYDPNSKDPKEVKRYKSYVQSRPDLVFPFWKENGIKVWVCLECWNTNDVPNCVEIVKWIVDNGYKDVVAGFEMGNETYSSPKYPSFAPYWKSFIDQAEKIWPKLPLGINIAELFELNPDLAHMKARLESQDPLQRNGYFTAAGYNQNSTRFVKELAASNVLGKIGHIIWHAYGCEEPYSCSYYGMKRFRGFVEAFPHTPERNGGGLMRVDGA